MRTLPLLAALFLSSPIALASTELERLQERCAEQERQILQLEEENSRLKSLMDTAAATPLVRSSSPAPSTAPSISEESAPGENSSPSHATVRPGDSLSRVAKRNGTTSEALIKLNKLKNPSLITPGQKLLLPTKASAPALRNSAPVGGSHIVKNGDTFYSIARQHGLSVESLAAANPSVKATALRPGQKLLLAAPSATSPEAVAARTSPAAQPAATVSTASTVTRLDTAASAAAPLASSSSTVSSSRRIRSVLVTEETDFGSFAAAHGTTIEKLNALNGHHLKSSTVLAKGSEFYVPAQP